MNLTITVPTTLSDMTLHQYQRFVDIQNQNDDQTFIFQKMIEIFFYLISAIVIYNLSKELK